MKNWLSILGVVLFGCALGLVGARNLEGAQQLGPPKSDFSYVGNKNCKKCHIQQWKSWEDTQMANALETLKPGVKAEAKSEHGLDPQKDYSQDAACLPCHTTGYDSAGGFTSVEETPELAFVGCESCHGPGGTYTEDQYMSNKNKEYKRSELLEVGLIHPVDEKVCVQCHNENNPTAPAGYTFDYEEMKGKGTHEHFPLKYDHD